MNDEAVGDRRPVIVLNKRYEIGRRLTRPVTSLLLLVPTPSAAQSLTSKTTAMPTAAATPTFPIIRSLC